MGNGHSDYLAGLAAPAADVRPSTAGVGREFGQSQQAARQAAGRPGNASA